MARYIWAMIDLSYFKQFLVSRESRLYHLVLLCDENDIKLLKKHLAAKKNKNLSRLFELMTGVPEEPSREMVFSKLYRTKYDKSKDYLLRNDYRLLAQEIEAWFRYTDETDAVIMAQKDYLFLKKMVDKHLWHIFIHDFERISQPHNHTEHYQHKFLNLLKLASRYFIPHDPRNFEEARRISEEHRQAVQLYSLRLLAESSQHTAYLDREIFEALQAEELSPRNFIDLSELATADPVSRYYLCKADSYYKFGEQRIITMKNAAEALDAAGPEMDNFLREKLWVSAMLGLEYSILYNPEEGQKCFHNALYTPGIENEPNFPGFIANYLSSLNKWGEYASVPLIFEQYRDRLGTSPKVLAVALSMKLIAHLFLGELKEARRQMNAYSTELFEHDWNYMRFMQVLLFIAEDDLVSADNELKNIRRMRKLQKQTDEYPYALTFIELLADLIRQAELRKNLSREGLQQLKRRIDSCKKDPGLVRYYQLLLHYAEYLAHERLEKSISRR